MNYTFSHFLNHSYYTNTLQFVRYVLSLQETLCGCRPKVLGNLRNEWINRWINGIPRKHNERINLSEHLNEPVLLETVNQIQYNRKRYEEYYLDNQVHGMQGHR